MPLNRDIVEYVEENIIPQYLQFDKAHNICHVRKVLDNSLSLLKEFDADINMIYIIAMYHDIGLIHGRKNHEKASAAFLISDQHLKKWFSEDEILLMANAVEDHRASISYEPRSIYGKIIAEADRDIDYTTILTRTLQYSLAHFPAYTFEQHYERTLEHLINKYGENGYLKLWLDKGSNKKNLDELRKNIKTINKIRNDCNEIYSLLKKDTE